MSNFHASILLLVHDPRAALPLADGLKSTGLRVEIAHTGQQALSLLDAGRQVDLLLVDIDGTPEGAEVSRRIVGERHLPLFVLTGQTGPELLMTIQTLPCAGVFPQSAPLELLLPNIQVVLSQRDRRAPKPVDTYSSLMWVVEQGPLAIVVTDVAGRIEYANRRFCLLTGYSADELLGHNPRILKTGYTTQEEYREMWRLIKAGKEWSGVFHNRKKNGELYWESAVISPIIDERGEVTHFIAVKENITERKEAELALQSALERQKILQRDIFHRTKNHLMQVMSLLDLQCALIHDPYDAGLLIEVQNRVNSMALLNEFLYSSGDMQSIDFDTYVRRLVENLVETYQAQAVQLDFQIEPTRMDANQVLPCALILTELVTNALKHAFDPQAGGRISISLQQTSNRYFLIVRDSGRGFAPDQEVAV